MVVCVHVSRGHPRWKSLYFKGVLGPPLFHSPMGKNSTKKEEKNSLLCSTKERTETMIQFDRGTKTNPSLRWSCIHFVPYATYAKPLFHQRFTSSAGPPQRMKQPKSPADIPARAFVTY
ncbi:hypothetical protein C4D60_Mb10t14960 [Musa balbisiana]|uniref:Uncharacterized protein n=1 Tax=Musa balbisiana TaxID=52838 RepID=A0A4S8IY29_MUSBA|nr:hypothetical protein C4D60_Mb10t14960 [Musa balbisiana]